MRPPPTGTVTFLFTDIEGSTKLWDQSPDLMRIALVRHDALIYQTISANGGHVFKTVGDAFCAAFATAPEALAGALAAQLALASQPWETETPLRVRMALHTGSAEERDGDYFGPPLNRIARLLATGHGGQTLLSRATQELTRDALPRGASLRDLGSARLKDLARPEHVFQLLHPDLRANFPPLRSLNNPDLPNNLPQQATSFVGREKEVAQIKALMGKSRLLTLTGAGGAGKTRLSLQVAADLLDGEGDGVWLVELAALSDPALVPYAAAEALGVKELAGQPMGKTLVDALKPKRLLLILDNCEHLIAACASLATELLRFCPGVHILASSREPLNVAGEQTYRVPSLSLPDPGQLQTVESVSQYEAVRLFIERAKAVRSAFTVTNANAPAVAQVCYQLDGIPLAIELAAARVRSLSVGDIHARLDQRFGLLTGGARTLLPRQQTLRALIDWSYDLLAGNEKALLARLSVFAGGWTLEAAEAVCAGSDATGALIEDGMLDLLTSLVDKSLVVYEGDLPDSGRSRLLETVRQYAGDRLRESGDAEARQEQAASWFLRLAAEAEPHLTGPEQVSWLSRLEAEHDNLRASLAWYDRGADVEQSLRLVSSLCRFWAVRGHYAEGRQWTDKALQKAKTEAEEREGAEDVEASFARARARAGFGAGYLAYNQGDYGVARSSYEESLAIFRRLGNQQGVTIMLDNLGNVAYQLGDYAGAQASYEESLALARQEGNERGIASSLGNLGNVAHELGDYAEARALHEACLTIQRQRGDERGIANSLNNLGSVAHELGDYAGAQGLHEASLAIQRQLGNQRGIANSLNNLGNAARTLGDFGAARALHVDSLTIRNRLGDQGGIIYSLDDMAQLASGQGQPERAARLSGAVSALSERLGIPLTPARQEAMINTVALLREALGEEDFTAAWDAGRGTTLEQAVEYALGDMDKDNP